MTAPLAWQKIPVGGQYSTVIPDMDFETYSEAGYYFENNKWCKLISGQKSGLEAVGAARYTEDPSAEVLSLAYDLKDGKGERMWCPVFPPPHDLLDYVKRGGTIEAQNSLFEYFVWNNICVKKYGWPPLPVHQTLDTAAKARAFGVPGGLDDAAKALGTGYQKDKDGKRLLNKFSIPKNPSKKDPRLRRLLADEPDEAQRLYDYNVTDIKVEADISRRCPDLTPEEYQLWLVDQGINIRGVKVNVKALDDCTEIVRQATSKYTHELVNLTGGAVQGVNQVAEIGTWLNTQGLVMPDMKKDTVASMIKSIRRAKSFAPDAPIPPAVAPYKYVTPGALRVLEIRALLGSAAVKKLYSLNARLCVDERVRGLFAFCGAERTGRFAGRGPQPQNFPSSGPDVAQCSGCGHFVEFDTCPACAIPVGPHGEWSSDGANSALAVVSSRSLATVEMYYKDPITAVSACLRALFIPDEGKDLLCSDYSAIEAVVLACLAGEEWRIDVFNDHGKIYEMSASKITGIPFEDFMTHKRDTGDHHPMRKKVGKVAELASGYQGGLGAWKNFGADNFMTDEEIKANVKLWRNASPMIPKFWYAVEDAARSAIQQPGQTIEAVQKVDYQGTVRRTGLFFTVIEDILYLTLPSGRRLAYHQPRLHRDTTPWGKEVLKITYMGRQSTSNGKTGAPWARIDTYGGKLTENIVQAVARDIFTHAMINLTVAGYPIVLHTHDEITSEVPEGFGSIEEFESIMNRLPAWCSDWPIKVAGGWRGKSYRKD